MAHEQLAQGLLEIKAIQINAKKYFTWTSGIKSPIYCDNRLTMSYPRIRKLITQLFKEKLGALNIKPDLIVGCATAGIPHAAWLADALDLPLVYVRSSKKEHGKGNQIEGAYQKGQTAIVIEDLISTGGSSITVAEALQDEGVKVNGVLAIFTYGLDRSHKQFAAKDLPFHTLTSFDALIPILIEKNEISEEEGEELIAWRNNL